MLMTIKRHVLQKYILQFEGVKDIVKRHVWLYMPQDDAILLKEPGFYCFLLKCKIAETKPFMETVLRRKRCSTCPP